MITLTRQWASAEVYGLLTPDAGKVQLAPELMDDGDYYPTNVGVVIDHPGYLPGLTGVENLQELASIRKKVGKDAVNEALERVGLSPAIKQTVRNYSLGMKQKLALAQAFMEGRQLLLLDEAFNGLDVSSVDRVRALLLDLKAEGRTILITSHQQEDMDTLCDHVWRINEGTLEAIR